MFTFIIKVQIYSITYLSSMERNIFKFD